MRKKIVAGNWKMNNDLAETQELLSHLKMQLVKEPEAEVMVAPAFTNLYSAFQGLKDTPVQVVAQNMHQAENGAYTGEVSAKMLKSIGVDTVILGHSERRAHFGETNEILAEKVNSALKSEMKIIFCFGEELADRKSDKHFDLVAKQLEESLYQISEADWKNVILAYEPVWAIGTGETASPEQAQEMHAFIRRNISEKFNDEIAQNVSILYGGSVKPANAKEIFAKEDVDGGLIGGASLKAVDFVEIINAF
ncbi:triose-phosphate isomerase [Salegentibacter mishustinae]|uniref:Triosephosphate isomerase n=1 Tax=Salegentibacter mishustinae TaxID=270918 RepID=A0A0Q9ZC01_9FLAO|nr:triose-phosphate isomerase [Salegentibacter mishustinae]KRG30588.1 triosephosphate isomerase [Salegentibacter mishustinae]PNW23478.1 triosephosphate isomerase [Salegentibacter mishustinae]PZX66551.1 triosephosphate isomerase [Salegentibacter mishustinae]GGW83156.1 triosephosphate isomerase [Salegentibacter mishustinae]